MSKSEVIGGKLKLKGQSTASKRPIDEAAVTATAMDADADRQANKQRKPSIDELQSKDTSSALSSSSSGGGGREVYLTEAQRRHRLKKAELLKTRDLKKLGSTSYRERLESFNTRLAKTTEHNDIPRISAAGNG